MKSTAKSRGPAGLSAAPDARLQILQIPGLPEIQQGDDLADAILRAAEHANICFEANDIVVIAQKVVSKAEGRLVKLSTAKPGEKAKLLAKKLKKDARFIEVVLRESRRIVRTEHVLIVETRHGFVCANAGVDRSNVPGRDIVALLPENPDRSAKKIRTALSRRAGRHIAVIISDTFGRAWRLGLTNVAIGAAGLPVLLDLRGQRDRHGKLLHATVLAVADELAAAAGLLMGKTAGTPVILIRGYRYRPAQDSASWMVRPADEDLFR